MEHSKAMEILQLRLKQNEKEQKKCVGNTGFHKQRRKDLIRIKGYLEKGLSFHSKGGK